MVLSILRKLGLSQKPPDGRKRVILVVDWPESGGMRVRDANDLAGEELLDVSREVQRLLVTDLRRQGYTWGGRKGNTRKKAVLAA
jgi:hypothetical protein